MSEVGSHIRASRVVGIFLLLFTPLAGPGSIGCVLAAVSAMTAYEGIRRSTVYTLLGVLFAIELIYGLDVGVLSLSYIGVVLLLTLVRRIIAVPSWASSGGWHMTDAIRTLFIACIFFAAMNAGTAIAGRFLYGYSDLRMRLHLVFQPRNIVWIPIIIAVLLMCIRRIDEPFRRRITFGA